MSLTTKKNPALYDTVLKNVESYEKEFDRIGEDRKKVLQKLASFVEARSKAGSRAELIFICTHNSRRSHISQVWAQAAAGYYGVPDVVCYSGGTEATAFNPRAVKAMEEAGFSIVKTSEGTNPLYDVRFSDEAPPVKVFSKRYDGDGNPQSGFGAVMTCSHADQNCPIVSGAAARFAIPYDDPKDFDGTPREAEMYRERVHQIGREMAFAFARVGISL